MLGTFYLMYIVGRKPIDKVSGLYNSSKIQKNNIHLVHSQLKTKE